MGSFIPSLKVGEQLNRDFSEQRKDNPSTCNCTGAPCDWVHGIAEHITRSARPCEGARQYCRTHGTGAS